MTKCLGWGIVLFFVAPILKVVTLVRWPENFVGAEFLSVLKSSVLQATSSSLLVFIFGLMVALGILSLPSRRYRRLVEIFLLLPSVLPALFSILASLHLVGLFAPFPFGFWGVVIVHIIMYTGLMGVFLAELIERRAGGIIELATVEGASFQAILFQVIRAWKGEMGIILFVVFALTFSSFSVPLVVGAGKGETLEVLIYRLLFAQGLTSQALILAVVQILILTFFAVLTRREDIRVIHDLRRVHKMGQPILLVLSLLFTGAFFAVNINDFLKGAQQALHSSEQAGLLMALGWGTAQQALATAVGVLFFGALMAFLLFDRITDRFFLLYSVPSVAVVGLAFYLFFDLTLMGRGLRLLLLGWAFLLTIFSSLYRLKLRQSFLALKAQVDVARILGASRAQRFQSIVWPQVQSAVFSAGGLAAFWASGDFALASMISGEPITLALAAQSLLGGYRLELATFFTIVALLVGGVFFFLFEVLGHVFGQKSVSKI